jgi:hypothetical protein
VRPLWERTARGIRRGEALDEMEIRPEFAGVIPDVEFAAGRVSLPALRKSTEGGAMEALGMPKPKKKGKKGTKAAKKIAAAQGVRWSSLSKAEKANRRLLARAEKGSERAAQKLAKRLGLTAPTAATTPATSGADGTLLKTVLPSAPDPAAAQSAIDAIKAALAGGRPGAGGWR